MALALGAVTACVKDEDYGLDSVKQVGKEGLAIAPTVSESPVKRATTRAESVDNLKEKDLKSLDVFVEHVTSGTGDGTFLKQYHLTSNIVENDLNKLADRWRQEGLLEGEKYNIYVAVNNPLTKSTIESVTALKALTFNEKEEGIAVLDDDGNIGWGTNDTSGDIYKCYSETVTGRAYTNSKAFMMDGVTKNWTPDPASLTQTFDVTLNRAAAKIVLNVKFDETFVKSLAYNKDDQGEYTIAKPDAEKVTITGTPAWKFNNFAFGAPVFTPDTAPTAGEEVHNVGFNIFHNQSIDGGNPFSIITYSYPNVWSETTEAPSLVVSIGYTQGVGDDAVTTYNYYRIPIVAKTTTSLNRNTIYVIDATIATRGSDSHEDVTELGNLIYEVLPWNDENNSDAIHNEVEAVQHLYLKVNPVVYTLRGDGDQSLIINYQKAIGTSVGWKLFAINPTTEAKGQAVESDDASAVWGWFYDKNGDMKISYSDWTHMGVTIAQSTEGTSGSSGTVTVTSTALYNRAIKYMLLRVYLKDSPTLYEDVLIRHFPTDNIQSITGSWSSYHTLDGSTTTIREYSWDPAADGWPEGVYQSESVSVEVLATKADYLAGNATRRNYDWESMSTSYYYNTRRIWTSAVPQAERQSANSEENSYGPDADGYYWWGSGSSNSRDYANDYDWIQGTGNNRYYRYQTFYYTQYVKTEQRTRYYRDVTAPATGNWVDWERDAGKTGTAKYDSRGDDPNCANDSYHAHIFSDGTVHYLNSTYNNNASIGDSYGASYDNNHMYVIQISSTSDKYVLGKPVVQNNVSTDQVVAPAFMIGSQLGIVTNQNWNNARAADHCSKYMEVAEDGTRYTGWRLPTADEIAVIVNYQQGRFGNITIASEDRVIAEVLKGANYYNLSGGSTATGISGATQGTFLRCIRELSAEEVDRLNGFTKIIEKYQGSGN